MTDLNENQDITRLNQMDPSDGGNFEYRLRRLEDERLPHRVTSLEFNVGNIQGEVVALKEIARGIGTKLDAGLTGLERTLSAEIDKLQIESARNQSFIKGVMWFGGGIVTLVAIAPIVNSILKRLIGM